MTEKTLADWIGPAEGAQAAGAKADGAQPTRRRLSRRLLVLAVLPWLVVAAIAGTIRNQSPPADPSPERPSASAPTAWPTEATRLDAATVAAVTPAVRAALAGASGSAVRLVDDVVVQSLERAGSVTVARVWALLMESDGRRWTRPRLAYFAVPLRLAAPVAVALGPPWPVPAPRSQPRPDWQPATDVGLVEAAASTAAAAGYRVGGNVEVHRSPQLPGVIRLRLRGSGPGDRSERSHELWLSDGPTPRLLGAAPPEPAP